MKQINKLIDWVKKERTKYVLKQQLEFYPAFNMYNADQFSFESINEIINLQQQLKTI